MERLRCVVERITYQNDQNGYSVIKCRAKGGISALTHAMAISLAGKVRVNSISPGWIDTYESNITGADSVQHVLYDVRAEQIAKMTDIG